MRDPSACEAGRVCRRTAFQKEDGIRLVKAVAVDAMWSEMTCLTFFDEIQ